MLGLESYDLAIATEDSETRKKMLNYRRFISQYWPIATLVPGLAETGTQSRTPGLPELDKLDRNDWNSRPRNCGTGLWNLLKMTWELSKETTNIQEAAWSSG